MCFDGYVELAECSRLVACSRLSTCVLLFTGNRYVVKWVSLLWLVDEAEACAQGTFGFGRNVEGSDDDISGSLTWGASSRAPLPARAGKQLVADDHNEQAYLNGGSRKTPQTGKQRKTVTHRCQEPFLLWWSWQPWVRLSGYRRQGQTSTGVRQPLSLTPS